MTKPKTLADKLQERSKRTPEPVEQAFTPAAVPQTTLFVYLDVDLKHELKVEAAQRNITIKALVTEVLAEHIQTLKHCDLEIIIFISRSQYQAIGRRPTSRRRPSFF